IGAKKPFSVDFFTRIKEPPTPDALCAKKSLTMFRRRNNRRNSGSTATVLGKTIHSVDAICWPLFRSATIHDRLILGLILHSRTLPVLTICFDDPISEPTVYSGVPES